MVAQDISVESSKGNYYDTYYTIRVILKHLRKDEGSCVQYDKPVDFNNCVQVSLLSNN